MRLSQGTKGECASSTVHKALLVGRVLLRSQVADGSFTPLDK